MPHTSNPHPSPLQHTTNDYRGESKREILRECKRDLNTPFGREKKEEYFKNILSFSLFGSLSRREWKGMEIPSPCLGV
jgi:hypothetical protein